ncbi:MAG: PQQ-binding-like beta-propeller repeat protein [Fimbriimonadales bacterium]|nr:PQQ-binding-like beta-propeller repeat protein [Fimbriimonadales bacterium]
MRRLWGVLWGASGIIAFVCADSSSSVPRTPNGMLWAGTTFQLRATATADGNLAAFSNDTQVRVGQVIRWQWQPASPAGQSAQQGNSAIFRVRVVNDGNAWDNLNFGLAQYEFDDTPRWTVALFENPAGDGQVPGSRQISGAGSLLPPGSSMLYLVRLTPPGSSIPTDGAWASLRASTSNGANPQTLGEFTAGVLRSTWVPLRAWCYGNQVQHVAPVLYQGQLFWMGTDITTNDTRIFWTGDTVENTQQNAPLGNERRVYGRVLRSFTPTGFSLTLGAGWFMGRGSQLIRIDLGQVVSNNTGSDPFSVVQFPAGVSPRLDLEPLVFNGRLYVAGSDNRLYAIREDGVRVGQSAPVPNLYGAFSTNLVNMGRAFYIGTSNGWILQFDAFTGTLRTARRITSQSLHSLAPTPFGRALLARAGDREILGINPNQLNVFWKRTLEEDIVSPVASSPLSEVGAIVTRTGNLLAFQARTGVNLPHYPQRVFEDQTLVRATLGFARRADRRATYVYILAQRDTGSPTQHQAMFQAVTLENPFNRVAFTESSLHIGSEYLPWMLFTGNRNISLCLIASRRASDYWGTVAAIPLR